MTTDTIVRIDPSTLLVGPNVRKDIVLGKEFVASIKQHGVLVPISAQETDAGLEVIDGQRRTLAAVDAGLAEVPVYVMSTGGDAARIIDQLIVNEHRAGISNADQVAAILELSLFEMPAQTISRKVGLTKPTVEQAIAVGRSERALDAMRETERPVSLEIAALIAEFDGDDEAQTDLAAKAANGWNIAHYAQEWRDKRALAVVAEQIKAMPGVTLIEQPGHNQTDPLPVRDLFLDAEHTKPLAKVPHAQLVKLAGDGLCAHPTTEWVGSERKPSIAYAVKGWKDRGLHTYSWKVNGSTRPTTPEDAEALKAARKLARESTKAWATASAVRIHFLQELVSRRTPPMGWELLVGARLISVDSFPNAGWRMAIAILQLTEERDSYSQRGMVEKHFQAHPKSAAQIMLATALGAVEGGFEFDRKGWQQPQTPAYLRQLRDWGYELSELEQAIANEPAK